MATETENAQQQAPAVSQRTMAIIIYALFAVGFCNGVTALIGVILAHVNLKTADPVSASHFKYQMRTFYWGLLWVIIGAITSVIVVGWFVLLAWFIWTLIRIITGLMAINNGQPIKS